MRYNTFPTSGTGDNIKTLLPEQVCCRIHIPKKNKIYLNNFGKNNLALQMSFRNEKEFPQLKLSQNFFIRLFLDIWQLKPMVQ